MNTLNPPLLPKNGKFLRVLGIARISTEHQDRRSLDDQVAKINEYLAQVYSGPIEWKIIKSQGSGEFLDRKEFLEAEALVEAGQMDVVIAEDLGRICRRQRAYNFCESCLDKQTRLIALNDRVDTGVQGWEDSALIATWHHERSNRDTAQRIRRSLRNRFTQGGVFQFLLFGYIKKPGGKTDADVYKDPAAEPIYAEWFRRLESGATYSEIADWLNEARIPTGPMSRTKKWTNAMVARITHNPLLKGLRVRNQMITKRINKTGRHKTVKAPASERLERDCPHLAFIDAERFDRVIAMLKVRNARFKRKNINGRDPRTNIPNKRTIWPGQHLRCGICNRIYYWSGANKMRIMRCSGNENYQCWNGAELNGQLASVKLADAIFQEIESLPGFDDTILEKAREQWRSLHDSFAVQKKALERRLHDVANKIASITDSISMSGGSRSLVDKLKELEQEEDSLTLDLREITSRHPMEPTLPSLEVIKGKAKEVFAAFCPENAEVGRLMRTLIPNLKVYPVQLCDGGRVLLRARVQINLAALTSESLTASLTPAFCREITVDLFDHPQRERFRREIMSMRAEKISERVIANRLGLTITATQRAAVLQRKMDQLGLSDPYVTVSESDMAEHGICRHLHPRYQFEILEGGLANG